VIVRPEDGAELELKGQAVFVSEAPTMSGVGVELRPFDPGVVERLAAFARGERVSGVRERPVEVAAPAGADTLETKPEAPELEEPDTDPGSEPILDGYADSETDSVSAAGSGSESESESDSDSGSEPDSESDPDSEPDPDSESDPDSDSGPDSDDEARLAP